MPINGVKKAYKDRYTFVPLSQRSTQPVQWYTLPPRFIAYYGSPCYDTTAEAAYSSKYPIARYLYVYLNKGPNESLDPLRAEFIRSILSKDGQTQTEKGGFFPITNDIREHDLEGLGISTLSN
jgi:phosphate transport system substrate-binding protein